MKIGIIGCGVVGNAIRQTLENLNTGQLYSVYDKYKPELNFHVDRLYESDIIFVCVPTPNHITGEQDEYAIVSSLSMLKYIKFKGIVVIKSTLIPGSMQRYSTLYPELRLVHNPEFLTEKDAYLDFVFQETILISGNENDTKIVSEFYYNILPHVFVISESKYEYTEWSKYIHNLFLATKVTFFNEVYNIMKNLYQDKTQDYFNKAVTLAQTQDKIGDSHTQVPGPDGKFGFGGMCFPKDLEAFNSKFNSELLKKVASLNNYYRSK